MRQLPSGSLRQTMRKRLRRVAASEPFGPLTQFARPSVAAKSPAPSVYSATISIEEMASSRAAARKAPLQKETLSGVRWETRVAK